jgi:cyclopropane-fatty-acyl-phospholipid synthase
MSRYFFSGGIMPSSDLPLRFSDHLSIDQRWHLNGLHYTRTCEAWLARMDSNKEKILPILAECYGSDNAELWWQRWRVFFMACSELFNYNQGSEWYVGHYLFRSKVN